MNALIFILEEESAKYVIEEIIKRLITTNINIKYITFQGKTDLENNLFRIFRCNGGPGNYYIIMRDQDSGDCHAIKRNLLNKLKKYNKENVSLVRIACHELESFFLGDLEAVGKGLNINHIAKMQNKKIYRNPDNIANASEQLKKITKQLYKKGTSPSLISQYLKLDGSNRSQSFAALLDAIKKQAKLVIEYQNKNKYIKK